MISKGPESAKQGDRGQPADNVAKYHRPGKKIAAAEKCEKKIEQKLNAQKELNAPAVVLFLKTDSVYQGTTNAQQGDERNLGKVKRSSLPAKIEVGTKNREPQANEIHP